MAYSWEVGATPTFRALSYDDYAKPLQQATDFHKEIETQYGELDAKASMWDKLANDVQGKDSKAYKQYKAYADDLRKNAKDLAENGLRYNTRRAMLNMVGRYSKEITPIEEAWMKRKALSEQQNKLLTEHPEMMTNRLAGKESIDFFMDNPDWTYETLSKQELYRKLAGEYERYKNLIIGDLDANSKALLAAGNSDAKNLAWYKSPIKGFYERAINRGYNQETLAQALRDGKSDVMQDLKATMMASGIGDWNFKYSYEKNDELANERKLNALNELNNYLIGATNYTYGDTSFDRVKDEWAFQKDSQSSARSERLASQAFASSQTKAQYSDPIINGLGGVSGNGENNDRHRAELAYRKMKTINGLTNDEKEIVSNFSKKDIENVTNIIQRETGTTDINWNNPYIKDIVKNYANKNSSDYYNNKKYDEIDDNTEWGTPHHNGNNVEVWSKDGKVHKFIVGATGTTTISVNDNGVSKRYQRKDNYDKNKYSDNEGKQYRNDFGYTYKEGGDQSLDDYMINAAEQQISHSLRLGTSTMINDNDNSNLFQQISGIMNTANPETKLNVTDVHGKKTGETVTIADVRNAMVGKKNGRLYFEDASNRGNVTIANFVGGDGKEYTFELPNSFLPYGETIQTMEGLGGEFGRTNLDHSATITDKIATNVLDKPQYLWGDKEKKLLVENGFVKMDKDNNPIMINGEYVPMDENEVIDEMKLRGAATRNLVIQGAQGAYNDSDNYNYQHATTFQYIPFGMGKEFYRTPQN